MSTLSTSTLQPRYKLLHFNSRVLAEPIRLLFAATGVEYTDHRVTNWGELKPNTPWGNLPLLEVDDQVIAQSGPILRYLGRRYNLVGDNDWEASKCDELIEAMVDLRIAYYTAFCESDPDKKKELETKLYGETFPMYLNRLTYTIKESGSTGYLVGTRLSIADLSVGGYLQIYAEAKTGLLETYPALKKHQELVFSAPGINEWVARRT